LTQARRNDNAVPKVVLWRLSFRVVGGYTKAPPEFAPCTVHTNKIRPYCGAAVITRSPIGTRPWNRRPHDMSRETGRMPPVSPAGYSEGLRAQTHQNCGSQTLRGHFSLRWQIDARLFVDDAGRCTVKKHLRRTHRQRI
jgi:hypothetical protein